MKGFVRVHTEMRLMEYGRVYKGVKKVIRGHSLDKKVFCMVKIGFLS
jgi:hypothetical protein